MSVSQSKALLRICLIYRRHVEWLQDGEAESLEPGLPSVADADRGADGARLAMAGMPLDLLIETRRQLSAHFRHRQPPLRAVDQSGAPQPVLDRRRARLGEQ